VIFLLLVSVAASSCPGDSEEFFVTCDAPVRVGGGIARHFIYSGDGRLSVRYGFGGTDGDTVLIEKLTVNSLDGSQRTEIIKVPLTGLGEKKIGRLDIGGHRLKLGINCDGRLIVKEIKG